MKLPAELYHAEDRLFSMKDVEAIVRDCAKVCSDIAAELQPYAERNYSAEDVVARQCADAILARYDLKP